jgi:hypothetical protein
VAASPSAFRRAEGAPRRRSRLTKQEIIEAIRGWQELYGEPPSMADWDPYRARQINQEWRIARFCEGDWPSTKSVLNHFGRLSTAVIAAGLTPRRQGQQRPDSRLAPHADVLIHLDHLRGEKLARDMPSALSSAVRQVAAASRSDRPGDLRASLVGLAAAALVWAEWAERDPDDAVGPAA